MSHIHDSLFWHYLLFLVPIWISPSVAGCPALNEFYALPNLNNMASNNPFKANGGGCAAEYQAGFYHSRVVWSKLQIDYATLRVNITDHVFATLQAGSQFLEYGYAKGCAGDSPEKGKAVVDLRGTPFAVEGPSHCSCTVSGCQCGQWKMRGWRANLTLTCTDNNQHCIMQCGGEAGRGFLHRGYLQLVVLDEGVFEGMCRNYVPSSSPSCRAHIDWALTAGKEHALASRWYADMPMVAGVHYTLATFWDFQRYFKCTNNQPSCNSRDLEFPPTCSFPPCDDCGGWCQDIAGWADSDGDTCSTYERNGWCFSSWVSNYATPSGISAATACCACQGGLRGDNCSKFGSKYGKYGCLRDATCPLLDKFYALPNLNNMASNNPFLADRGSCEAEYQAGFYHSRVVWSKLQIDYATLRVNITDHVFATLQAGSQFLEYGYAKGCAGDSPEKGKAVVDLRGTPFAVEGPSQCSCTVAGCQCGQWRMRGFRGNLTLTCTDNNQHCIMQCGGESGWGFLHRGYLQLVPLDEGVFEGMCRNYVPSSCRAHIDWALTAGKEHALASRWYADMPMVAGVHYTLATFWDFQRYFKCTNNQPSCNSRDLEFPPTCSFPPCDNCGHGWQLPVQDMGPAPDSCRTSIEATNLNDAKTACQTDPHCFAVVDPATLLRVGGLDYTPGIFYGMSGSTGCGRCPEIGELFRGWNWYYRHQRHVDPTPDASGQYRVFDISADSSCSTYLQGWTRVASAGPTSWACPLHDVVAPRLTEAQAACARHPHCYAVVEAGDDAQLDSGTYAANMFYGMSSMVGCELCAHSDRRFSLWAVYYRGPRHVDALPDSNGRFRMIDVWPNGACSFYSEALFASRTLIPTTSTTCAANGYSSIRREDTCWTAVLALGMAEYNTVLAIASASSETGVQEPECSGFFDEDQGLYLLTFGTGTQCSASGSCVCAGEYVLRLMRPLSAGVDANVHHQDIEVYSATGLRRPLKRADYITSHNGTGASDGDNETTARSQALWGEWVLDDGGPPPAIIQIQNRQQDSSPLGLSYILTVTAQSPGQDRLVVNYTFADDLDSYLLLVTGVVEVASPAPAQRCTAVHRPHASMRVYTDRAWTFSDLGSFVAPAGFTYISPPNNATDHPADSVQLEITSSIACTVYLIYPQLVVSDMVEAHRSHRPWIESEGWGVDTSLRSPTTGVPAFIGRQSETRYKHFGAGKIKIMGNNASIGMPLIFVKLQTGLLHRTHNLALGAVPFASGSLKTSCLEPGPRSGVDAMRAPGRFCWSSINDGVEGNEHSWQPGAPYDGLHFAGVKLAGEIRVRYITWGRDNTGRFPKGKWEGVRYTLQYTSEYISPTLVSMEPSDLTWLNGIQWTTYPTSFTLTSAHTHVQELNPAVPMTAMRFVVSSEAVAIDEIGVHMEEITAEKVYDSMTDLYATDPRQSGRYSALSFQFSVILTRGGIPGNEEYMCVRHPESWLRLHEGAAPEVGEFMVQFIFTSNPSVAFLVFTVDGNSPSKQRFDFAFQVGVQYKVHVDYSPARNDVVLFVDGVPIQVLQYTWALDPRMSTGYIGSWNGTQVLRGVISDLIISNMTGGAADGAADCQGSEAVVEVTTKALGSDVAWEIVGAQSSYKVVSRGYTDDSAYTAEFCLPPGDYELRTIAAGGDGWHGGTLSLSRDGASLFSTAHVSGGGSRIPLSVWDEEVLCGTGPVDLTNVAVGLAPTVSSTCAQSKTFLTDGDYPCHTHNTGYWQACVRPSMTAADAPVPPPWAQLTFPERGGRCVREIRVWPRCDLTLHGADDSAGEMAGASAEVLTQSGWRRCGARAGPNVTRAGSFTFACALFGTAVRVYQNESAGGLALSEVEVFPQLPVCTARNVGAPGCTPVAVHVVPGHSAAGVVWALGGTCPSAGRSVSIVSSARVGPSASRATVVCLAAGDYQLVVSGDSDSGSTGAVTVALLDGSTHPAVAALTAKRARANAWFTVPARAEAPCNAPTVNADGCVWVSVNVSVGGNGSDSGGGAALGTFSIEGSCPLISGSAAGGVTGCLAPGDYTFVAVAPEGEGWGGFAFSVGLDGARAPFIRSTVVTRYGLRAPFKVPSDVGMGSLSGDWLHQMDGRQYINLPAVDNWSESYPLVTTWQKLRISGPVARGQTAVYVDLTDTTYATSNGMTSDVLSRRSMKWGMASDCRGGEFRSGYRLNLKGTPFRLESGEPRMPISGPDATGGAVCRDGHRFCEAECGGGCGECGFGRDQDVQVVKLVVADRWMFDDALKWVVDCGPPSYATYDFPLDCDTTSQGTCQPQCAAPYAGAARARCGTSGEWEYGRPCTYPTCFTMGWNSFGQLGTGTTRPQASPHPLPSPDNDRIHSVAVAGWHSAVLTGAGAYVMGSNQYGQLGLPVGAHGPDASHSTPLPLPSPNGHAITGIALGNSHTVLVAGGEAYASGDNSMGQLGLPTDVPMADTPHRVRPPTGAAIAAVFAGSFHTAFITEAGSHSAPQSAPGDQRTDSAPVPAQRGRVCAVGTNGDQGPAFGYLNFTECLEAARAYPCRAFQFNMQHWESFECRCCLYGQQGQESAAGWDVYSTSTDLLYPGWRCVFDAFPVRLNADGDAECMSADGILCHQPMGGCAAALQSPAADSVACGAPRPQWGGITGYEDLDPKHWCSVARLALTGSQTFVMGWNSHGMLGLSDTIDRYTPTLLASPFGDAITFVTLGRHHSAFLAGQRCYVFGRNSEGQLGLNVTEPMYSTPQLLAPPNGASSPITQIQAGHQHTAFISDATLFVMGDNSRGQLGLPNLGQTFAPEPVVAPNRAPVTSVAVGAYSTVFVAGRNCYVMGFNANGQLGLGSFADIFVPQELKAPNGLAVDRIAVGWFHTAFTADVTVTPTATVAPSVTGTATSTPSMTPTTKPSCSPTSTVSGTASTTSSCTLTSSLSIAATSSPSSTATRTTSTSTTPTFVLSNTPTSSLSSTSTTTASATASFTPSRTLTSSLSITATSSPSSTPTHTTSTTPTFVLSNTPTSSLSSTSTTTASATASFTPSRTLTSSFSITATSSPSSTPTHTTSTTPTFVLSNTPTSSLSSTSTTTASATASFTPSRTLTLTFSITATSSPSSTPTRTTSTTPTFVLSNTPTSSLSSTSTTTASATASFTPSRTLTSSCSIAATSSPSSTPTHTTSTTPTFVLSNTPTSSLSSTSTTTASATASFAPSRTLTSSCSIAATSSPSSTPTRTTSTTPTFVLSNTPTSSLSSTSTTTASATASFTPSRTLTSSCSIAATSSPSSTPTRTTSTTPTFVLSNTPTSSLSSTSTTTASATASFTPSRTLTLTFSIAATSSPSSTPTRTTSTTPTFVLSNTPTSSLSSTSTTTASATASFAPSRTPTSSCSIAATSSPSSTPTHTTSTTPTFVLSNTPTSSLSSTSTTTASATASFAPSRTLTSSCSIAATSSPSSTPTHTTSTTPTFVLSNTPTSSLSSTSTTTASATASFTPSRTLTSSCSIAATSSPSSTPTRTTSTTPTFVLSNTPTSSLSSTSTTTASATASFTPSRTLTASCSIAATSSPSSTPTRTTSTTPTFVLSNTPTSSLSSTSTTTASATASFAPSRTLTSSCSIAATSSPSSTPTHTTSTTPTFVLSNTPTSSLSSTSTTTASATASFAPSRTLTLTFSIAATSSPSSTPTRTTSTTPTFVLSNTPTSSLSSTSTTTASFTPSHTSSLSITATSSASSTPTSSPSYTPTIVLSSTPTPSPPITPTSSLTPTARFSLTPTNSRSPSAMFTATTTPSHTATPSRLFTPTDTPSRTPTASVLYTPSSTPTQTPPFTRLSTPTNTPSPTPTASVLYTPSETPTPTTTPSRPFTLTDTLSRLFTPTTTLSQTPRPTCSSTITPSMIQTSSPSCSATLLDTPSSSPTPSTPFTTTTTASTSRSPTSSPTVLPTPTPSPTGTAFFDRCTAGDAAAIGTGRVQLQSATQCIHSALMGAGSSFSLNRNVMVHVLRLDGNLTLQLASGCTAQEAACVFQFTPQHVGQKRLLPVGTASIEVVVLYTASSPTAANRRQPTATSRAAAGAGFAVDLVVVHTASAFVVLFAALGVVAVLPCCLVLSRRHAQRIAAVPLPKPWWEARLHRPWPRHPRWRNPWVQVVLVAAVYAMIAGVVWYAVFALMTHPDDPSFSAAVPGLVVAALGLALLIAAVPWALREDGARACPACGEPASSWRLSGTYLPVFDGDGALLRLDKAHTDCVRCVECRKAVVMDRWDAGPPHRPYHLKCWQSLCARLCAQPSLLQSWAAAPDVADLELASILAESIRSGSSDCMAALLAHRPDLDEYAVPGVPRARHCAAKAGRLPELQVLLRRRAGCLDACDEAEVTAHSIRLTGLGFRIDDLYVRQDPLSYNGREVYVGHKHGGYLYFFYPQPDDTRYGAGWRVSDYLGNGNTAFRLPLDPQDGDESSEGFEAPPQSWVQSLHRKASAKKHSLLHWHGHGSPKYIPGSRRSRGSDLGVTVPNPLQTGGGATPDDLPFSVTSALSAPATAVSTVSTAPLSTLTHQASMASTAGDPDVPLLSPTDFGLQRVPQAASLLQFAVESGDEPTIRYVFDVYKERHPHCLRWQHHLGHGLWRPYDAPAQQKIAQALARQSTQVTLDDGRLLDLARGEQRDGAAAQRIRCHAQSVFQPLSADDGAAVTSAVEEVRCWDDVFVTMTSGALSTAAPDPRTLQLLATEGIVDPTLWGPPSKHGALRLDVPPTARAQWYSDVLAAYLHAAFAPPEGVAVDVLDARRRGREEARRAASRFADGLARPGPSAPGRAFFAADYRYDAGTFAFCLALPGNDAGLYFERAPVAEMCAEAVLKVHELQRQRAALSPVHVVPIYVYTYELPGASDQIYSAMNKAMRTHDARGVAFWRPLIWQVDRALERLPAFRGKLYRGINVRFSEAQYRTGQRVCWAPFSSASAEQAVAKEFVKGDEGSLFFLHSAGARAISRFSKFPDEAEVLFRPNTVFEITSTLYGTSDIGQFYSGIDNISMAERTISTSVPGATAPPDASACRRRSSLCGAAPVFNLPPTAPGADMVIVTLPAQRMMHVLTSLAYCPDLAIDTVHTYEDDGTRQVAHVDMVEDQCTRMIEIPTPRSLVSPQPQGSGPGPQVAERDSLDYAALGVPCGERKPSHGPSSGGAGGAVCSSPGPSRSDDAEHDACADAKPEPRACA